MRRKICPACNKRPVAINYRTQNQIHYRSRCDRCSRQNRLPRDPIPTWVRSGYQKKEKCEKCNFKSSLPEQMFVWYLDGDHQNNKWSNLKTICSNCKIELTKKYFIWTDDKLKSDL
jgi:hypothetical protein